MKSSRITRCIDKKSSFYRYQYTYINIFLLFSFTVNEITDSLIQVGLCFIGGVLEHKTSLPSQIPLISTLFSNSLIHIHAHTFKELFTFDAVFILLFCQGRNEISDRAHKIHCPIQISFLASSFIVFIFLFYLKMKIFSNLKCCVPFRSVPFRFRFSFFYFFFLTIVFSSSSPFM